VTYARPYWLPNENEVGRLWRSVFNAYMKNGLTIEEYERMLLDNADRESHITELQSECFPKLRAGFDLYNRYSEVIYESLEKKTRRLSGPDEFKRQEMQSLADFLLHGIPRFPLSALISHDAWGKVVFRVLHSADDQTLEQELRSASKLVEPDSPKGLGIIVCNAFSLLCCFLEMQYLRNIFLKTWQSFPGNTAWSRTEFDIVQTYFSLGEFGLTGADDNSLGINPTGLEFARLGGDIGFIPDALQGLHTVGMCDIVADFIDELLLFNKFAPVKGSAQCEECGQMYPRDFYGHGQKYCSKQCKSRANKRAFRERDTVKRFQTRKRK